MRLFPRTSENSKICKNQSSSESLYPAACETNVRLGLQWCGRKTCENHLTLYIHNYKCQLKRDVFVLAYNIFKDIVRWTYFRTRLQRVRSQYIVIKSIVFHRLITDLQYIIIINSYLIISFVPRRLKRGCLRWAFETISKVYMKCTANRNVAKYFC